MPIRVRCSHFELEALFRLCPKLRAKEEELRQLRLWDKEIVQTNFTSSPIWRKIVRDKFTPYNSQFVNSSISSVSK